MVYLWLGIALIVGPDISDGVQNMTADKQSVIILTSGVFSGLSAVMLATKCGFLRTTAYTTDQLALPLVGIYTLALLTL